MTGEWIIETEGLTKKFGDLVAVDGEEVGSRDDLLDRFEEISAAFAEPDADYDTLIAEQARVQDAIDRADAWSLDATLDRLMQQAREEAPGELSPLEERLERDEYETRIGQLRKEIDRYHLRQRTKPGITGWAQINQNYDTSIDDVRRKVEYDLAYIERRSVVEDMRIMARKLRAVFS